MGSGLMAAVQGMGWVGPGARRGEVEAGFMVEGA